MNRLTTTALATLASCALFCGCGTTNPDHKTSDTKPVNISDGTWHKDKDIQRVWLAPGFDFKGYDGVYIAETKYTAKERSNETQIREWAVKYVRERMALDIPKVKVIPTVYTSTNNIPAGAKILNLENTIYEYEKGGGGARYWAGIYGAGQPLLSVRGVVTANDQPVFKFEATRKGESGAARMFGGFRSDQDIQTEDINDLAYDLADFIRRTATHVAK